jgi:hypothetical protein
MYRGLRFRYQLELVNWCVIYHKLRLFVILFHFITQENESIKIPTKEWGSS